MKKITTTQAATDHQARVSLEARWDRMLQRHEPFPLSRPSYTQQTASRVAVEPAERPALPVQPCWPVGPKLSVRHYADGSHDIQVRL